MNRQHALAAVDVFGLLCQEVTHEHVEAVLVQGAARLEAYRADV